MKLISLKSISSLSSSSSPSSPYKLFVAHFSASSNSSPSRHEFQSRNVRVSVWWDFHNCKVPFGVNAYRVAHTITAALRANGIKGPVTITAFGDVVQMSRPNQEGLTSTGINIAHVPHSGKNSADRSLLVDLMYWVSRNPPPAHLFLISGDRDFASILHRLRMNNYNILLSSQECVPDILCNAASIMWNWDSLVRGENLAGKHFNQPPDGPYGSWYGHYKGPVIDPFSVAEQPAITLADDPKLRPVPKPVIRKIRHILNSFPKGVPITELWLELSRSHVIVDKDLYGYGKFSRFLLSMPNILELKPIADGQFLVCGTTPKAPEPFETGLRASNGHLYENGDQEHSKSSKLNDDERLKTGATNAKLVSPSSPEAVVDQRSRKGQQLPSSSDKVVDTTLQEPVQQLPLSSGKIVDTKVQEPLKGVPQPAPNDKNLVTQVRVPEDEGHQPYASKEDSASDAGFFKKNWLRWFGSKDGDSEIKSQPIPEECSVTRNVLEKIIQKPSGKPMAYGGGEKTKVDEKYMGSTALDCDPEELVQVKKTATIAQTCGDKSTTSPGVLSRIVNWFKFRRSCSEYDSLNDLSSEKLNHINRTAQKHEVFLKDSFWLDMESFLDSPKGSAIIFQSRTRKQMAQNFKEEGPLVLRDLSECDLLDLLNLLISEKKWVEEWPSEKSPFRLSDLFRKKSSFNHSRAANGLRSIFINTPPQSDRLEVRKQNEEKANLNIQHAGVSAAATNKISSDRSRNDILADCQKLVGEILKEHPEGYYLGSFRKLFMERYGYHLAVRKLGYQKLATLLMAMPGVKIESTCLFPSSNFMDNSGLEISFSGFQEANSCHPLSTSDESDSQWEELGPVSNLSLDEEEGKSGLNDGAVRKLRTQTYPDYEPSVSDDEFTDSEGNDTSSATQPEGQGKPGVNDNDSSLLQILDSWYSTKEGDNKQSVSENDDGKVDSSSDHEKPPASSKLATTSGTSWVNIAHKQRPQKSYSFVSDPLDNDNDKLIDGVLGSMKPSGKRRCKAD